MRRVKIWDIALLVSFGLGGVAGCSREPLAPALVGIADPNLLRVSSTTGTPEFQGGTSNTKSAKIDGNKGGSVNCGRFTVDIPPGAFKGPATITVTVPDVNVLQCDLSISPAAANSFAIPVTLTTDCKGTNVTDPASLVQVWYDPAQSLWFAVPGYSVDQGNLTVSAPLAHFSEYGISLGKAGW